MNQELMFNQAFLTFISGVTKLLNEHQTRNNLFENISLRHGTRYVKIVVGTYAWAFIDKKTGDVLKPASFNKPAKKARGNIYDAHNGLKYLSAYGPNYLR